MANTSNRYKKWDYDVSEEMMELPRRLWYCNFNIVHFNLNFLTHTKTN